MLVRLLSISTVARRSAFSLAALAASTLTGVSAAHAQQYTLTYLGQLANANGSQRSQAYGINDTGTVTGYSNVPYPTGGSTMGAFVYKNGTMTSAGTLSGGNTSTLVAINASGIAAGTSNGGTANTDTAVLYNTNTGVYTQIGPTNPSAPSFSSANGINDAGAVVGNGRDTNTFTYKPYVYTTATGLKFLPTLDGDTTGTTNVPGTASAINNAGQIVGNSGVTGSTTRRAYFVNPNNSGGYTTTDLVALGQSQGLTDSLGGTVFAGTDSISNAISGNFATGYLAYTGVYSGTTTHLIESFIYNISTNTLTNLGLSNGRSDYAYAINSAGTAVGYIRPDFANANSSRLAYVTRNGVITDLNTVTNNLNATFTQGGTTLSFTTLNEAHGINNLGQITGWGLLSNGTTGAFLLTPTGSAAPEPSAWALALLALPGTLALARCKRGARVGKGLRECGSR